MVKGETFWREVGNSKYGDLVEPELKVMNNTDTLDDRDAGLIHLHTCIHCGHSRQREEVGEGEVNSGTLHCPRCGFDGPLNIEIRDLSAA
jgi:transcription elongation factor Elf1